MVFYLLLAKPMYVVLTCSTTNGLFCDDTKLQSFYDCQHLWFQIRSSDQNIIRYLIIQCAHHDIYYKFQ